MSKIKNNTGLLSAAEQTRLTWARAIEDFDHIPPVFQDAFRSQFTQTDEFPYTLLTPSFAGFLRPAQEKLVCCTEQALTIFEKHPESIGLTAYSFNEINRVESGQILLYSWLSIIGIDHQNKFCATTIRFNTVGERLFQPIISRMRPGSGSSSEADLRTEQAKFNYLGDMNYKFMNFGRRSIRPGDRVLKIILQPEQRQVILRFLGKSLSRLIFPAHLIILTGKEIIDIRDASKIAAYGGIWNYVPLGRLSAVSLEEENGLLRLCLELPLNDRVEIPFVSSLRADVAVLRDEIRSAMSGQMPGQQQAFTRSN